MWVDEHETALIVEARSSYGRAVSDPKSLKEELKKALDVM